MRDSSWGSGLCVGDLAVFVIYISCPSPCYSWGRGVRGLLPVVVLSFFWLRSENGTG